MPRASWPLLQGRPIIQIVLTLSTSSVQTTLDLLADSGAGSDKANFDLLLNDNDCLKYAVGSATQLVKLGGAYTGLFSIYGLHVQIPLIGFNQLIRAVGLPQVPSGFGGLAGFRFLNRFTYGNFGDPGQFGIEI